MRKTILCLLLVVTMVLLAGCGGKTQSDETVTEAAAEVVLEETAPEEIVEEESYAEPEYQEPELLGGIQTAELDIWGMDILRISYDADSLICDNYGSELGFFEPESGMYFSAYVTSGDAQDTIDSFMGYDWVENYWASPVSEQYINDMLVQSFTHSYTSDGYSREATLYLIPIGNDMSVVVDGDVRDGSIIARAFVSMEGDYHKPVSQSGSIILSDPAGNAVYNLSIAPWAKGVELISNENGRASFQVTSQLEDGNVITKGAELHVNAYPSGDAFFNAISGKYWDMYTPFEREAYGGKFVDRLCFWELRVNGTLEQYTDTAFYLQLPDGNLITGVCDEAQSFFIGACVEGLTPVQ